jgi:preprotein translocase subunit SecE
MGTFIHELFQVGLYKRTQGRMTRRITCAVIGGGCVIAAYLLMEWMRARYETSLLVYGLPLLIVVGGCWAAYRIINLPRFADFLIAVEAEMNKVSWPSWPELVRSSLVVIFVIFFLAFVLFGFDLVWKAVFKFFGVLQ